jgi:hypothetical protein
MPCLRREDRACQFAGAAPRAKRNRRSDPNRQPRRLEMNLTPFPINKNSNSNRQITAPFHEPLCRIFHIALSASAVKHGRAFTCHSPLVTRDCISNRRRPRLEMPLTAFRINRISISNRLMAAFFRSRAAMVGAPREFAVAASPQNSPHSGLSLCLGDSVAIPSSVFLSPLVTVLLATKPPARVYHLTQQPRRSGGG